MSLEQIASLLWRRRILFAVTLLVCVVAVVAVTIRLPKSYQATATLLVGGKEIQTDLPLDTGLAERLTRTYTTLAGNPNVADSVRQELTLDLSREELLDRMSFSPVERTQLLQISADGPTRKEAQLIANTYATVFQRRVQEAFDRGSAPARVLLSERASLPINAYKPNPPLYIGLGTLLALLLAAAVVLIAERLDRRLRVAEDDESVLGQPILGRIPTLTVLNTSAGWSRDSFEVDDAFRLLKTNIDFTGNEPVRLIAITSAAPLEGKTTVSANLAVAAANDGERVVLVEADLRRPRLAASGLMGDITAEGFGLSGYLVGATSERDVVVSHPSIPTLSVVWAGAPPPNPTSLLRAQRLENLLDVLAQSFDRIIIDTPPISVGADASVVASRAAGTLYVIDAKKTSQSPARAGLNQLRRTHARLLGVVVNRATVPTFEGYYTPPRQRGLRLRKADEQPSGRGLPISR
jgi:capsular exopolysaccharide synthesis family protein